MNSIIFMSAWQGAGYQMMIFLAGLQGIPKEQYEAASIDGAGKLKSFLYVTFAGTEKCNKICDHDHGDPGNETFYAPYVMTKGRPSEFHQNHGVLCV